MTHQITLREKQALTHDVHRFVFDKPEGLSFRAGQATELTLESPGWRDEGRPFTFTSQPGDDRLEFIIKSYPEHDGVTEQLGALTPGADVEIEDPFGAIEDHGPGTFIAAGAGITPFIPILRRRALDGNLKGCRLVYTNKTVDDIILREEWADMADLGLAFTVTEETDGTVPQAMVDRDYLATQIDHFDQHFYVCGPGSFVDDIRSALLKLGADPDRIVTEEGW